MYLISHRGNINGPNQELENSPSQIDNVISKGFDCEIDLWDKDGLFYLGHDEPQYQISLVDLMAWNKYVWIHTKNREALEWMIEDKFSGGDFNFFWHEKDKFSITSKNFMWCYPSEVIYNNGINVMPEKNKIRIENLFNSLGVCSDYISLYKKENV